MNLFFGKALLCLLLAAQHVFATLPESTTATDTTVAASSTASSTTTTVTTTTSNNVPVSTVIAGSSSSTSSDINGTATAVSTDGNGTSATRLEDVTTTFASRTPSTAATSPVDPLTDELLVRFSELDFSTVPKTGIRTLDVDAISSKYSILYSINVIDDNNALVPRSRNQKVFAVGSDAMPTIIRFFVSLRNVKPDSSLLLPDEQFVTRGFFLRNASLVLSPGFDLERDAMKFSFQPYTVRDEDDKSYLVRQPVFNNTINTYPLASVTITCKNSQFALESFHVSILLDRIKYGDFENSYSENYDGLIAGVVVGGLCGSFLLVACIVGIIKCAVASTKV
jgi:hypothetical protein